MNELGTEVVSFDELAKLLNISGNKLTRLIGKGLPYIDVGYETKMFLKNSVLEWLKNRETTA